MDRNNVLIDHAQTIDLFLAEIKTPEVFLTPTTQLKELILKSIKILFDHAKNEEQYSIGKLGILRQLIVHGFDTEQIWQQLSIHNTLLFEYLNHFLLPKLTDPQSNIDFESDFSQLFDTLQQSPSSPIDSEWTEDDEHEYIFQSESSVRKEAQEEVLEAGKEQVKKVTWMDISGDPGHFSENSLPSDDDPLHSDDNPLHSDDNLSPFDEISSPSEDDPLEERAFGEDRPAHRELRKHPLDDQFFSYDEMIQFADEGEDGKSGLLINNGSEDEMIYEMMYGEGDLDLDLDRSLDEDGDFNHIKGNFDDIDNKLRSLLDEETPLMSKEFKPKKNESDEKNADEIYFNDFYDVPTDRKVQLKMDNELDNDDVSMDSTPTDLTRYELEKIQIREKMDQIEDQNIQLVDDVVFQSHEQSLPSTHLSDFSKQQSKMKERIDRMENESLKLKSWQMMGETVAKARPENSLLEEVLDFDHATKIAPIITTEVTLSIENSIKRRIMDLAFDDVIRAAEKRDRGDWRDRSAILDMEKSQKSLSKIYEDQYLKEAHQLEDQSIIIKEHQECAHLFKRVCFHLDLLANMNYVPIKYSEEAEIKPIPEAPAMEVEEVTPLATSTAVRLAPEEIYPSKSIRDLRGQEEWTLEEKKGERRERKKRDLKKKKRGEEMEKRERINHPSDPKKLSISQSLNEMKKLGKVSQPEEDKNNINYQSSIAVFKKLQDHRTEVIKRKKSEDQSQATSNIKM